MCRVQHLQIEEIIQFIVRRKYTLSPTTLATFYCTCTNIASYVRGLRRYCTFQFLHLSFIFLTYAFHIIMPFSIDLSFAFFSYNNFQMGQSIFLKINLKISLSNSFSLLCNFSISSNFFIFKTDSPLFLLSSCLLFSKNR